MTIIPLDTEEYWKAIIEWKPPRKWSKEDKCVYLSSKYKNEYGIYRFERRHGNQKDGRQNLYIGLAFKQIFDTRLHQGYHENKIKKVGRGQIWVSLGIIDLNDNNHSKRRYEEIEKILIYFTQPLLNKRKKSWEPDCNYEIINKGNRGPLPKSIKYPVAEVRNR